MKQQEMHWIGTHYFPTECYRFALSQWCT